MVVDILLLLAGLVFGINDPDVNNRYVEYSPGNTNLVFTVPHDGQTKLASIPIRQNVTVHIFDVDIGVKMLFSSLYTAS